MKRRSIFPIASMGLLLLIQHPGGAVAAPPTPDDVARGAIKAVKEGRLDDFARAVHPQALAQFRSAMSTLIDGAAKEGKTDEILRLFDGAKGVDEVKALDAAAFMAAYLRGTMRLTPEIKERLAKSTEKILGDVAEGGETVHVVYRPTMPGVEARFLTCKVLSLRKDGPGWGLLLSGDIESRLALLKQSLAGKPAIPRIDFAASRLEPLGRVTENGENGHAVYRLTSPIGDIPVTMVEVLSLGKADPGFAVLREGKPKEVARLIGQRIGIEKEPPPDLEKAAPAPSNRRPGPPAGEKARSQPRTGRTPGLAKAGQFPPTRSPAPVPKADHPPEGFRDLPPSFFGGDRDRFRDFAPPGGVLVGVHVSYIMRFGGPKISSIRPVYRSGDVLKEGKRHGGLLGKETTAIARPVYAVGALKTHTGLTVDGFELVFMRIEGDHLDPSDSYTSPWLGDEKGGSPRDVSSEGKLPVGLLGRAGKEVNALGLIVEE
jgi:hypothetical protein